MRVRGRPCGQRDAAEQDPEAGEHGELWDIETARKQPSAEMAATLDAALDAGGALADLVTVPADDPDRAADGSELVPSDADRHHLAQLAERARSGAPDLAARSAAGRWAQYASFLYDTFVRSRPPLVRLGASRYSRRLRGESGTSPFRAEVQKQGRTPAAECRSVTRQPASEKVAERLRVEPGTPVVRRENWYYADAELIQIGVTYVPVEIVKGSPIATSKFLGRGSLYSRFEDLGYQIDRMREEITTRLPASAEAAALHIHAGVPVLEVMHTSFDKSGQPFEVTCFTMRADLAALEYELLVAD